MLAWSELRKTPSGTTAAPDLLLLLRLSKTQLKTSALQEEVVSQVGGGGRVVVRGDATTSLGSLESG